MLMKIIKGSFLRKAVGDWRWFRHCGEKISLLESVLLGGNRYQGTPDIGVLPGHIANNFNTTCIYTPSILSLTIYKVEYHCA